MNDPVDRLLMDRARADVGFPGGLLVSLFAHILTVGAAFAAPFIFPAPPPLIVAPGFAMPLPRGGGGDPNAGGAPSPPAVQTPAPPDAAPPAPEPPPKVLKPPKEEPRKGLPEFDAKKKSSKPDKPTPRAASKAPETGAKPASAGASHGGSGSASGTAGLVIGPPGSGVAEGVDGGDWYMGGVVQKVSMLWAQQIKTGFNRPIGITFTILSDGSVTDLEVTEPSGATLLDLAAQRAILSAAPFGPLPKEYEKNRHTVRLIFKPTS